MNKLRIAFIGCGGMSSRLQQCMPMIPQVEFVATCDLVREKAESNARRFGALRAYTDYEEMLVKEELDAVAVVGRPEDKMHRDLGIECLKRGKHIYTEKPPAWTAEGARQLVDTARDAGKFGQVGTMWRHAPVHRMAKDIMAEPDFGSPVQFEVRYQAPGPILRGDEQPFAWPFMVNQLIHPVDCMRYFMGPARNVRAAAAVHSGTQVLSASATVVFENGAIGSVNFGNGPVLEAFVYIKGSGNQVIQCFDSSRLERFRNPSWKGGAGYQDSPAETFQYNTNIPSIGRAGYLEEMVHWASSLLNGKQPEPSLEDAWQNMRVLEAISASVESGQAVSL